MISIVVAVTENDVIGRDNGMPWHLPDDLKYFKARTMGKPMLMGRKTFESIGKPLPGRTSVVLTRDPAWHANGVVIVRSLDEAMCRVEGMPELCAIGGAEIFRLVLPLASRLFLTRIHANIPGDTFFPRLDASEWREVERTEHPADARHAHAMSFVTLDRISQGQDFRGGNAESVTPSCLKSGPACVSVRLACRKTAQVGESRA